MVFHPSAFSSLRKTFEITMTWTTDLHRYCYLIFSQEHIKKTRQEQISSNLSVICRIQGQRHSPLAASEWLFWVCPVGLPECKVYSHAVVLLEKGKNAVWHCLCFPPFFNVVTTHPHFGDPDNQKGPGLSWWLMGLRPWLSNNTIYGSETLWPSFCVTPLFSNTQLPLLTVN